MGTGTILGRWKVMRRCRGCFRSVLLKMGNLDLWLLNRQDNREELVRAPER